MYHSLSKLLQETQAAAAKKLGVLENALAEDYPDQDSMMDPLQAIQLSETIGEEEANVPHPSNDLLTLREHQIW